MSLIGYIGINKNVGVVESDLYISDLPEITTSLMDKIADDEQLDFKGVWEDVEKRAIDKFMVDVMAELSRCFQINKKQVLKCIVDENKELLGNALLYLIGIELLTERIYTQRLNRFTTVEIAKARTLRDEFREYYQKSLVDGVTACDVSNCVEDLTNKRGIVSYEYVIG